MSTTRIGVIPDAPKGHCRHCQKAVPRKRRTWCSQQCVTDALIRKGDPLIIRREVYRRDRGVCSGCGLDTDQVTRILEYLLRQHHIPWPATDRANAQEARLWLYRTVTGQRRIGHLWEADHIVAVIEGGGGCDLSGYRTLCRRCHKRVTAELAIRRAQRRHEQTLPLLSVST